MLKRSITAIFIVIAVVGSFLLRQFVDYRLFNVLIYAFCVCGSFELVRAFGENLTGFQKTIVFAYALTVTPIFTFFGISAVVLESAAAIFLAFMSLVFEFEKATLNGVGLTLFAFCYPTGFLIPMMMTNAMPGRVGFVGLLFAIIVSTCSDTAAYLVGSLIKGPKFCQSISPKKTISGAIGGVIGGIIGALFVYFVFGKGVFFEGGAEWLVFVLAGATGSILTEFGDLLEGAIKRKLNIKDSGNILPGHGGMLDRIDGMMLDSVFTFALLTMIAKM